MPRLQCGDAGWITPTLPPICQRSRRTIPGDDPIRNWKVVRISWMQTVRTSGAIAFAQEGYVDPIIKFTMIELPKGWFEKSLEQLIG
jgi:hypothetical protein